MKKLFSNLWLQLAVVTAVAFAPGIWIYLGILIWFAYFVVWANEMYDQWQR